MPDKNNFPIYTYMYVRLEYNRVFQMYRNTLVNTAGLMMPINCTVIMFSALKKTVIVPKSDSRNFPIVF